MIKLTKYIFFSPELQKSLALLQESAKGYAAAAKPLIDANRQIRVTIDPIIIPELEIESFTDSMRPLIQEALALEKTVSKLMNVIPDLDVSTLNYYAELTSGINDFILKGSIPSSIFEKASSEDIDNYLDDKLQEFVEPSLYSEIQEYEENLIQNETTYKSYLHKEDYNYSHKDENNSLKSDLTSAEWHKRMWIEAIYQHLIIFILAYLNNLIDVETLQTMISALVDIISN